MIRKFLLKVHYFSKRGGATIISLKCPTIAYIQNLVKVTVWPKTALMLLHFAKFTNIGHKNHQKYVFFSVFFQECPTIVHCDGRTYLKSEDVKSVNRGWS